MSYPPQGGGAPPKNNMGIAVASLVVGIVCGCILTAIPGIMAVVQAGKVNNLATSGNFGAANEAAEKAKRYAIIGFVVTAIVFVIVAAIYGLAIANSDTTTNY